MFQNHPVPAGNFVWSNPLDITIQVSTSNIQILISSKSPCNDP